MRATCCTSTHTHTQARRWSQRSDGEGSIGLVCRAVWACSNLCVAALGECFCQLRCTLSLSLNYLRGCLRKEHLDRYVTGRRERPSVAAMLPRPGEAAERLVVRPSLRRQMPTFCRTSLYSSSPSSPHCYPVLLQPVTSHGRTLRHPPPPQHASNTERERERQGDAVDGAKGTHSQPQTHTHKRPQRIWLTSESPSLIWSDPGGQLRKQLSPLLSSLSIPPCVLFLFFLF